MAPGGGQTGGTDGTETDNVIRFPKDWFGSTDDLIPFGPSAERIRAERAARQAAAEVPRAVEEVPDPGVLSAEDFWGGDSERLQEPIELTEPTELPGVGIIRPWWERIELPRIGRPAVSACVAVVLVVLACVAFVISHGGRSRPRAPGTHATTSAVVSPAGLQLESDRALLLARDTPPPRAAKTVRRHPSRRAHRAAASHHRYANHASHPAAGSAAAEASTTAGEGNSAPVSITPVTHSSSTQAAGTTRTATRSTGAGTGGPDGLGGTVGLGCNPVCPKKS